ncbi:hypothetical protein EUTSA_v10009944mg [Eutrema salsugineum]|uniref:F-box associated beta-propeller type 1 domain-containing protein n=1 Tax=Eutrema salsugineum TaxID=72664 RepID=V4K947_EUTSA|nr:hypothetical protein EUTSA_v10009944mg [Eutrema salsugineum]
MTTTIYDLGPDLVEEKILAKVPITSLRAVRSTCKLWHTLTKEWVLGRGAARQQFLGFMTLDLKVFSVRFNLCRKEEEEDLVDLSIKKVASLEQVLEISKVIHCDGLLLCLTEDKWIEPRTSFHTADRYALGYDKNKNNHNHKILRFLDRNSDGFGYEIYDLSSGSWRVLDVSGNTYFFAQEKDPNSGGEWIQEIEDFLICFDFTTESFGQRLPLPFHSYTNPHAWDVTVTLSCVRDEQLAVLHNQDNMLVKVRFYLEAGSFFVDEEEKLAVVFDLDRYEGTNIARYLTICDFGEAPNVDGEPYCVGDREYCSALVCPSSYIPSLIRINQTCKRKERDD